MTSEAPWRLTMATKPKTFDCVEMKRRAQEEIMAEYEARRGEFASYSEFLEATIRESPWASAVWKKFGGDVTEPKR